MKDLILLVADKDMEYALRGLLSRQPALGIRAVSHDVLVHPRRDPGVLLEAQDFLRTFSGDYAHALVLFDHEGSGHEDQPPAELREDLLTRLSQNGWVGNAEVIILVPELEVWVWSASPHVAQCLGWAGRQPPLATWLQDKGHWPEQSPKPPQPKEAMDAALCQARKPRSSSIYRQLAERVTLQGHTEPAFTLLTDTLRKWFTP